MRRASALALLLPATLAAAGLGFPASRQPFRHRLPRPFHRQQPHRGERSAAGRGDAVRRGARCYRDHPQQLQPRGSLERPGGPRRDRARRVVGGRAAAGAVGPAGIARAAARLHPTVRSRDPQVGRADSALHGVAVGATLARLRRVYDSYASAAADVQGPLPAGDAWRAAWRRDPRWRSTTPTVSIRAAPVPTSPSSSLPHGSPVERRESCRARRCTRRCFQA